MGEWGGVYKERRKKLHVYVMFDVEMELCMHMYAYNCCTNVSIYRDMMYLHVLRLLPGTRAYFGGCKIVQMQF